MESTEGVMKMTSGVLEFLRMAGVSLDKPKEYSPKPLRDRRRCGRFGTLPPISDLEIPEPN